MGRIGLLAASLAATCLLVPAASAQTSNQLILQMEHGIQRLQAPAVALPTDRKLLAEIALSMGSGDSQRDKLDTLRRLIAAK